MFSERAGLLFASVRSGLFGGEPMASLLASCRQHSAAAFRLHAYAEAVRFGAAAAARLKCALWQSNPPLIIRSRRAVCFTRKRGVAYWSVWWLTSNLQVYATATRTVKKRECVDFWCATVVLERWIQKRQP